MCLPFLVPPSSTSTCSAVPPSPKASVDPRCSRRRLPRCGRAAWLGVRDAGFGSGATVTAREWCRTQLHRRAPCSRAADRPCDGTFIRSLSARREPEGGYGGLYRIAGARQLRDPTWPLRPSRRLGRPGRSGPLRRPVRPRPSCGARRADRPSGSPRAYGCGGSDGIGGGGRPRPAGTRGPPRVRLERPPATAFSAPSRVRFARGRSPRTRYLVDPASSHMLVSKIKPCMSKYELIQTVKLRMAH